MDFCCSGNNLAAREVYENAVSLPLVSGGGQKAVSRIKEQPLNECCSCTLWAKACLLGVVVELLILGLTSLLHHEPASLPFKDAIAPPEDSAAAKKDTSWLTEMVSDACGGDARNHSRKALKRIFAGTHVQERATRAHHSQSKIGSVVLSEN